jgi:hypothetical protein
MANRETRRGRILHRPVPNNIPTEFYRRSLRPVRQLRHVIELDFRKIQRNGFEKFAIGFIDCGVHAGDKHVGEVKDDCVEARRALPAHGEPRILDMFAARAGQHDLRRRRVNPVRETKIAKLRLGGTRAAAPLMNDRLRNAPIPGQHEDFVLVPVVGRLALDVS